MFANSTSTLRKSGFTLLETVIAIGVLAVLLTGFMVVFAPAAAGIRKSINVQEADRLQTTVEEEFVTLRTGQNYKTGFDKAFEWIKSSSKSADAVLVYQYRGSMANTRQDGTPEPISNVKDKMPGSDYKVVAMVRQLSDSNFKEDLEAVEGGVYLVKCTQLIFGKEEMKLGTPGEIVDPKNGTSASDSDSYPEATIAFAADFYMLSAKSQAYFDSPNGFQKAFTNAKNPVFTRNLAVRR